MIMFCGTGRHSFLFYRGRIMFCGRQLCLIVLTEDELCFVEDKAVFVIAEVETIIMLCGRHRHLSLTEAEGCSVVDTAVCPATE